MTESLADGRPRAAPAGPDLLSVNGLTVSLITGGRSTPLVDGVSLALTRGATLGLVGESGSGKSLTALSIIGLLPPRVRVTSGQILFEGHDLLSRSPAEWQTIRGRRIGFVFQEPMTALNPVMPVGRQVAETLSVHGLATGREALRRAVQLLEEVALPDPVRTARRFAHELSGGMRQRVMIALAIACRPSLLIADEPTAALDVTVQAQILDLIATLQRRDGLALLLITHDLGVAAQATDRIAVMYAGQVVEDAPTSTLFARPLHPYTRGLLASVPRGPRGGRLRAIAGVVPPPGARPPGCVFAPRCEHRTEQCDRLAPAVTTVAPSHRVRCHLVAPDTLS